ncbi:MAG: recombinase family protein [Rhodopila sp.]
MDRGQVRICRARAEREGWTVIGVYADYAISGATAGRPQFQQLLTDARAGRFNVILAEALDQISRDQEHIAGFHKQVSFAGVQVITIAEGAISELHVGLKGTMSAMFLKDLAQKTHRGLEGRVRSGRSGGGLCYSYRVKRGLRANGTPITGEVEIDADEAAMVGRIFTAYTTGQSPRAIAKQLNAEGVAGPRGGRWIASLLSARSNARMVCCATASMLASMLASACGTGSGSSRTPAQANGPRGRTRTKHGSRPRSRN